MKQNLVDVAFKKEHLFVIIEAAQNALHESPSDQPELMEAIEILKHQWERKS